MLIDRTIIEVRSGKGGDGRVSFRREKFVPKGGPDGGDGGRGGDVVLVVQPGVDTLLDLTGRHHWHASDGGDGRSKQQHGPDRDDLMVLVPPGTLVYDDETGELLCDLDEPDKRFVAARGGKGGFGNEHYKSPTNQTPQQATPGEPGESKRLRLELKLIADIGLIGMPNAGKSTLLAAVSAARPKVADYPFTTLEPHLGIADLDRQSSSDAGDSANRRSFDQRRLVIADIPGLIEGAGRGQGLGHDFLRHIERTRLLVHLIEIEPADGSDPAANYQTIRGELADYSHDLADKPQIVVVSKTDLLSGEPDVVAAGELLSQAIGLAVYPISAATGRGLHELLEICWKKLAGQKRPRQPWSI